MLYVNCKFIITIINIKTLIVLKVRACNLLNLQSTLLSTSFVRFDMMVKNRVRVDEED